MEILAIIPARGGSKSIPRKNIKLLGGIPLLAYSIAAAKESKRISRVIVSTDDAEIADIAREWGAEVPFMRPAKIAADDTPDLPVFIHALNWLSDHENYEPAIVVQLRPTSPFRPPRFVDRAIDILLKNKSADSVRAVTPSGQNPYKMWSIKENGYMASLLNGLDIPEPYNMPRQKLPKTFWQTGHVDVIRYSTIVKKNTMTGKRILPIIIDSIYAVDIDNVSDWRRAEWLMKHFNLPFILPGIS